MELLEEGYRQSEIAKDYGVSRQYVHRLAKQGGHQALVTKVSQNFPWEITDEMYENTIYQALRLLGHYQLDPDKLKGTSRDKLKAFLRKLTLFNQVVDYDPDYPAVPGLSNTPGFAYVPRTESDKNYAVKIKPGVRITNTGERLWTIPEVWP